MKERFRVSEVDLETFMVIDNHTDTEICVCTTFATEIAPAKIRAERIAGFLNIAYGVGIDAFSMAAA